MVVLLVMLLSTFPVFADLSYISAASIFELGVSARTLAMGGTFIGLADDQAAVFYNPAGLPQVSNTKYSSLFTRPFGAYSYGVLGVAQHNWGAYFLLLDSGSLEERDLCGNSIGDFRYTSMGLILGWGHEISNNVSVGLQGRAYGLASPVRGVGISLSPSILVSEGARSYALVWQNRVSTGTKFTDDHTEPWASDLTAGFAWKMDKATFCMDFTENLIIRGDIHAIRLGYEYSGFDPITLRAGTNRDWTSFGASVRWKDLQVDIAYLIHYALAHTYVVSVSYQQNNSPADAIASPIHWFQDLIKKAR